MQKKNRNIFSRIHFEGRLHANSQVFIIFTAIAAAAVLYLSQLIQLKFRKRKKKIFLDRFHCNVA
jgi:hypothetical protein